MQWISCLFLIGLSWFVTTPASAQFLGNGNFEKWAKLEGEPPTGVANGWGGSQPIRTAGLAPNSEFAALIKDNTGLFQQIWPTFPSSFHISQVIAIDQVTGDWQQPFIMTLQCVGPGGDFAKRFDWIQLRISGSGQSLSLAVAEPGGKWKTVADRAILTSTYESTSNRFTRLNAYALAVAYDAKSNAYSVSFGLVGEKPTVISRLDSYLKPNNSQPLALVTYWGYGGGDAYAFAIDDITVTEP